MKKNNIKKQFLATFSVVLFLFLAVACGGDNAQKSEAEGEAKKIEKTAPDAHKGHNHGHEGHNHSHEGHNHGHEGHNHGDGGGH
ncbi:MAG: hypothetical protein ACPG5B_12665 [Chitinophagales bacterium]